MSPEIRQQIMQIIQDRADSKPSSIEFEMAYQARVAMDRIRFAIKHIENFAPTSDAIRQIGLQLLDALQRLETLDRRFQVRSVTSPESLSAVAGALNPGNGQRGKAERETSVA